MAEDYLEGLLHYSVGRPGSMFRTLAAGHVRMTGFCPKANLQDERRAVDESGINGQKTIPCPKDPNVEA